MESKKGRKLQVDDNQSRLAGVTILIITPTFGEAVRGGAEFAGTHIEATLRAAGAKTCILAQAFAGGALPIPGQCPPMLHEWKTHRPYRYDQQRRGLQKVLWHLGELFDPRDFLQMSKLLNELTPNVVIVNSTNGFGLTILPALKGIPTIFVNHDLWLICQNRSTFRSGKKCEELCTSCKATASIKSKLLSPILDDVLMVAPSKFMRDKLAASLYGRKYRWGLARNPVRVHQAAPIERPQVPVIGFAGRLVDEKGVRLAVAALEEAAAAHEFTAEFVGGGELHAWLCAMAESLPWLKVIGSVSPDEVESRMRSWSICLIPSLWEENAPIVLDQAVAAGAFVLCTPLGGASEVLRDGLGETVANLEPETWARSITTRLNDKRSTNPEHVRDFFASRARSFLDVVESVGRKS